MKASATFPSCCHLLMVHLLWATCCWGIGAAVVSDNRTVVFMFYQSNFGDSIFLRGGVNTEAACTDELDTDPCKVGISTHLLGTISQYDSYNAWRVGDQYLDWHGPEPAQGMYEGVSAQGTPTVWTTSNILSPAYQPLNTFGDNYWMVDMEMDCTAAEDGWFDVKGYLTGSDETWEGDIAQSPCTGTLGGSPPYSSSNHIGRCGAVNVFYFNDPSCVIDDYTAQ